MSECENASGIIDFEVIQTQVFFFYWMVDVELPYHFVHFPTNCTGECA